VTTLHVTPIGDLVDHDASTAEAEHVWTRGQARCPGRWIGGLAAGVHHSLDVREQAEA